MNKKDLQKLYKLSKSLAITIIEAEHHKVVAINRRRFFIKKLLNFLSRDFTKSYTVLQIANFLDADPEKVNYGLAYLAESGIIKNRKGRYGISSPTTASYKKRHTMASKKKAEHTKRLKTHHHSGQKSKADTDVSGFNNWVKLTPEQIKQEYEWEYISHIEHEWPIFKDFKDFKNAIKHAKVLTLTPEIDRRVANRSHTHTIEELKDMTSYYRFPRDVDRIVHGFETNARMPMPILLKLSGNRLYIMSGNTRADAAFILGITPKVLVVDALSSRR